VRASFRSWGTIPKKPQSVKSAYWASDLANLFPTDTKALPVGNGRSYGDSCLLATGSVIQMTGLNRLISFDTDAGVIKAEAGIRLCDLLEVVVPLGWFLPVTPGTAYITLGGAVANDVHGKNHHCDGPFGRYIQSLELLTSDQTLHQCSPTANTELFAATVGGLGLTGIITTIELQLIPITTSWLDVRYDSFASVEEFAQLSSSMKDAHRYTVAWMDCATKGTVGRGVLMSANHSEQGDLSVGSTTPRITVPFACPKKLLNKHTIKTFNALYFQLQNRKTQQHQHEHYQPYFYPLDAIGHWNRIYGKNGFHQYQFVVPLNQLSALSEILNVVINSGMGSFLAVLKEFGDVTSPGIWFLTPEEQPTRPKIN